MDEPANCVVSFTIKNGANDPNLIISFFLIESHEIIWNPLTHGMQYDDIQWFSP